MRKSKPVEISGKEYEGKYNLDRDSAKAWIKNEIRGNYKNKDTGDIIEVGKDGAQKVTSHSMGNEMHVKSLAAIPGLIENSIFIEERPNEKITANMTVTDIMPADKKLVIRTLLLK